MIFTYNNAKISLNGSSINAQNVSILTNSNLSPVFKEGSRYSDYFSPENIINGTLRINYYLSEADPLFDHRISPTGLLSGNFGGLYFSTGYLKEYNIDFSPNNPISVSASIDFYHGLSGSFSPTYERATQKTFLHTSDISLTGTAIGNLDEILSMNYQCTNELNPQYYYGEQVPRKVLLNEGTVRLTVETSNILPEIKVNGSEAEALITIRNPNGLSTIETIFCHGYIEQKQIESAVNGTILNRLSFTESYAYKKPTITRMPGSIIGGQVINVAGTNLHKANKILFCINGETVPRGEGEIISKSRYSMGVIVPDSVSKGLVIVE